MLKAHTEWFDNYVSGYLSGNPDDDHHIDLKKRHSLGVLQEAQAITASLSLSNGLAQAAHLGALYHDLGRFYQYQRYKTFRDDLSFNHAYLGIHALRAATGMPGLDTIATALVRGCVVLHNRRVLPVRLDRDLDTAVRIVRDSDKLDIIRIMLEYLRPGGSRSDVVTLHAVDEPDRYTPELVEEIGQGRIGDYRRMRFVNDFNLLLLSWVYDLNFPAARRAYRDRGHVESLFGLLPKTPELTRLKNRIYKDLDR